MIIGEHGEETTMLILFQGDSFTDCGRRTSGGEGHEKDAVGPGYPGLVKSHVMRVVAKQISW